MIYSVAIKDRQQFFVKILRNKKHLYYLITCLIRQSVETVCLLIVNFIFKSFDTCVSCHLCYISSSYVRFWFHTCYSLTSQQEMFPHKYLDRSTTLLSAPLCQKKIFSPLFYYYICRHGGRIIKMMIDASYRIDAIDCINKLDNCKRYMHFSGFSN